MDSDLIRIDLEGPLAGRFVMVDPEVLDCGLVEDMQSGQMAQMMDAVAKAVRGGDLPHGFGRADLRKLKPREFRELANGVARAIDVPKVS